MRAAQRLRGLFAVFAVLAAIGATTPAPRPVRAAATLPIDHLHFGLASGPNDLGWMTATGGWRYRYQYLAGGVNTPGDWQTWQDPSRPPGQFVLDYSSASAAADIVPVFTYYELLQSTPSTGATESDRDSGNLNDAATMRAYYADFAVLMRRLGQYGGPAIVHVEPDLWGYLEQRAAGGSATALSAVVGSSGMPDVAGIPDTVAGYADALLLLRDRYAPNVAMAIHASMWGSGVDVASDTSPNIDGGAVGRATGAFLASAGVASNPYGSTWDLVFHDVDDHDAGWWDAQGSDNASFTHWWDPTNARFPDFARWLQWVAGIRAATGRPQVAWQVPIGNQHYLTMDNTCGHYQDNIAEYVLAHPAAVAAAGVVAVLFGAGNACQTSNLDAQSDGVTNNGGVPTTDAAGGCLACNTATSTVSDDDGGYLRGAVPAYETAGPVATGVAPPPTPTSGYWLAAADGGIFPFGDANGYGSTGGIRLNRPIVSVAETPSRHGYWLVASDGGVFPFGDALGYGSTGGIRLNRPIVGLAPTPDGRGYWLVASDGGIFPFGDAAGYGSTGATRLNQPVVGMAAMPDGHGYWLVASDGGIFPFGDAPGLGSTGGIRLNRPIVGMAATTDGRGYWLVASDGGIFPFGDATGHGSTGAIRLNQPIVGMAPSPGGQGYWLVASDGGIFPFGDAAGEGSTGGRRLNAAIIGMAAS